VKEKIIKSNHTQVAMDNDYFYLEYYEISESNNKEHQIAVTTHDWEPVREVLELVPLAKNNNSFSSGRSLTSGSNGIYFARRFDNNIYKLANGNISVEYTIDFDNQELINKLLNDKNIANHDFWNEFRENKTVFTMTDVMNNDNYLSFNTNIGSFIYDKTAKQLKGYDFFYNSELALISNNYYSLGDKIAYIYYPGELIQANEMMKEHEHEHEHALPEKMSEILSNLKEDDNPIVYIYDFK
jgi:hypothetical protein